MAANSRTKFYTGWQSEIADYHKAVLRSEAVVNEVLRRAKERFAEKDLLDVSGGSKVKVFSGVEHSLPTYAPKL